MSDTNKIRWRAVRQALSKTSGTTSSSKTRCKMVCGDARRLLSLIPDASIDCIITSPPYGALKNYGSRNQLGFGQHAEKEYLPDLNRVIGELYRVAKAGAALWVVSDTLRANSETIALPWQIIDAAKRNGWIFQDVIIWDKGRSLPWSHNGRFRGVCEYISLFAKERLKNFNVNAARQTDHLSSYWVRYPERFHPGGKAPSDLWHFPIPIQGSWGQGGMRHFCPFPVGLVARMVALSTSKGGIVLDPFAGTGSVIAVASHMNRYGIGIEANAKFVRSFDRTGFQTLATKTQEDLPKQIRDKKLLGRTILQLRMQKYPKTLFAQLSRGDRLNGEARDSIATFVLAKTEVLDKGSAASKKFALAKIKLLVLVKQKTKIKELKAAIKNIMRMAPLSKFGVDADVQVVPYRTWTNKSFLAILPKTSRWYVYRKGTFFNYEKMIDSGTLHDALREESAAKTTVPAIISSLKLKIAAPVEE